MNGKKPFMVTQNNFDLLMLIVTFAAGLLVSLLLCFTAFGENAGDNFSLGFTALMFIAPLFVSVIGMWIVEIIRGMGYTLHKKGNRIISLVLILVLGSVLGIGGQTLYSLMGYQSEHEEVTETSEPADCDIVLLVDSSNNMEDCFESCQTAAKGFIDSLDESARVMLVSFSSGEGVKELNGLMVFGSGFEKMDSAAKQTFSDAVDDMFTVGGSDVETALEEAAKQLQSSGSDVNKAVVIMTDNGDFGSSIAKDYASDGIQLYSVVFEGGKKYTKDGLNAFAEAAEKTGALSISVEKTETASPDFSEMTASLGTKVTQTTETVEGGCDEGILFMGFENLSILRFVLRLIVFILYGLLASYAMYFTLSVQTVVSGVITSAAAAVILTFLGFSSAGLLSAVLCSVVFVLVFCTAVTKYYMDYSENQRR